MKNSRKPVNPAKLFTKAMLVCFAAILSPNVHALWEQFQDNILIESVGVHFHTSYGTGAIGFVKFQSPLPITCPYGNIYFDPNSTVGKTSGSACLNSLFPKLERFRVG